MYTGCEKEIEKTNDTLLNLKYDIEAICKKSYISGFQSACESIRVEMVQYCMDNKIPLDVVHPFSEITKNFERKYEKCRD